jgi:hypothetical protein
MAASQQRRTNTLNRCIFRAVLVLFAIHVALLIGATAFWLVEVGFV